MTISHWRPVGSRIARRSIAGLLAVGCLAIAVSCRDRMPTAPARSLTDLVSKGRLQVIVQQDMSVRGDSAVFLVQVVGNGVPVASYQGTLTFNAAALQVMSVETPTPQTGEFFVANADDAANGRIRFAGFATRQFSSTEVMRVVARVSGGLSAANLAATIDVAGGETGLVVPRAQIQGSDGVHDAQTNALVRE